MSNTTFDPFAHFPADYFVRARESLTKIIEGERFDEWTGGGNRRYLLVTNLCVVENDIEKRTGTVTGRLYMRVYSDSVDDLFRLWRSQFIGSRFDSTVAHFIVDLSTKKVVNIMSLCA